MRRTPQKPKRVEDRVPQAFSVLASPVPVNATAFVHRMKRCLLSPIDMNHLRIYAGDLVCLTSTENKQLGAIAWPDFSLDAEQTKLSTSLRRSMDVELNATISISQLTHQDIALVDAIALTCLQPDGASKDPAFIAYIAKCLMDMMVLCNNEIVTINHNNKAVSFKVSCSTSSLFFRVSDYVSVDIQSESQSDPVSLNTEATVQKKKGLFQLGGLDSQIKDIKQLIDLALYRYQNLRKYGLDPPRGILLHGPHGTGKTMLAHALKEEYACHFVEINAAEIVSGFVGETEAKIRDIFTEAIENAPSIIFMDDIDTLCPRRDDSASELEKRIVAQVLTLMDGSKGDDSKFGDHAPFVVIATTTKLDTLDEALRRPGRFDKEIEIGIPTPSQRFQILKTLLSAIPNTITEDDLQKAASKTHGYVGADLAAVCREAGMQVLMRLGDREYAVNEINISFDDVLSGLRHIRPSAMREIALEIPTVRWTDIGGQHEVKKRLQEAIEWPIKNPELFKQFGIKPPKGLLLYGPPGCSKTLMAKALATETGLNFLAVKGPELFSKYVGESEKAVRDVFRKARAAAPAVIFFDEIDSIASKRGADGDSASVGDRVLAQLLTEMDGVNALVNVTIIAATNRPDTMDSALLRPGRFDRMLYVGPPDFESRKYILTMKRSKCCFAEDVNVDEIAVMTEGYSGAEMVALCQEAGMLALEESEDVEEIHHRHFVQAVRQISPRITDEMIEFYEAFAQRSGLSAL